MRENSFKCTHAPRPVARKIAIVVKSSNFIYISGLLILFGDFCAHLKILIFEQSYGNQAHRPGLRFTQTRHRDKPHPFASK